MKDLDLLLEVAARLGELVPGVRVIVVGQGPEGERLRRQAAERGLSEVVEFAGEVRPVWPALAGFSVYVLTSISEGLPLSVLEAMAAGLPVVGTRVGGLAEAVEEGVTGYLIPREGTRDQIAGALAERVAHLLGDEGWRRRLGAAARQRVAAKFSTRAAALGTLAVYGRCLAERGHPAALAGAARTGAGDAEGQDRC